MRYSNFKSLIEEFLHGNPSWDSVECFPGPADPEIPGAYILLTPFGGPGTNTEGLFDGVGWQVKTVSEQEDYIIGESMAYAIDYYLRSLPSGWYHGEWVTNFQRSGGAPATLMVDDAQRTHFVCSYVVDVESTG